MSDSLLVAAEVHLIVEDCVVNVMREFRAFATGNLVDMAVGIIFTVNAFASLGLINSLKQTEKAAAR